jgi:hypothetical protein
MHFSESTEPWGEVIMEYAIGFLTRIAGNSSEITVNSVARSAGFLVLLDQLSWGSATLHPRLYAAVRSAD